MTEPLRARARTEDSRSVFGQAAAEGTMSLAVGVVGAGVCGWSGVSRALG